MKRIITIVLLVSPFAQIGAMNHDKINYSLEQNDKLAYGTYHRSDGFICSASTEIIMLAEHLMKMIRDTTLTRTQEALTHHIKNSQEITERLESGYYEHDVLQAVIEAVKASNKEIEEKLEEAKREYNDYLAKLHAIKTSIESKVSLESSRVPRSPKEPVYLDYGEDVVQLKLIRNKANEEEKAAISALLLEFASHNPA